MTEQEPVDVFALAAKPIGAPEMQGLEGRPSTGLEHCDSPEAREAAARANKKWLPAGKRSVADANRKAHDAAMAAQLDLEDAVEAAGGARGTGRHDG